MLTDSRRIGFAFLVYAIALFLIAYVANQSDFLLSFSAYAVAFLVFLYFIRVQNSFDLKTWNKFALLLMLIPFFSNPSLSPDVYRFLWDGELVTMGIHPYASVPNELMESNLRVRQSTYMNELFAEITDLSKRNYSIYPSVNQFYFLIAAFFSDHLLISFIILRLLMLLTMVLGYKFLLKTLDLLSISNHRSLLLLLNPILIVEVIGNFHFEGIMLSWLIIGIYFLIRSNWLKSSLFWAIAINIKLTPLILLPFVLRFRKFSWTLKFYFSTLICSVFLMIIYLWPTLFWNFMQSIELYFDNFEFNAGVFYLIKWITSFFIEGNPTLIVGPILSIISFLAILCLAFFQPIKSNRELLTRMMWGYVIYLMLATTVHPWYVILPLGLSIFSANIGVLIWSLLIMLSYGFYAVGSTQIGMALIAIEYLVVIVLLVFPKLKITRKLTDILRLN
ncbi:hypothetical protein [Brumimicrobium aurantiacum]|uniref:DUF2029 domain-containing protein n=1 Tax=Brumimicrobium aurantiacum TaxID=1737063 RepID=A0A3E1EVF0_9FLAO|nr:hypothetical protein [Brumimicrobium aurantiacum]RFC53520.1 hypothetical protein DXU93_12200 [Brumimicrobium aurantiacum]